MEQQKKDRLKSAGIDVADALGRFMGNEGMYEKFLNKFLNDQNYSKLKEALEAKDYEAALSASHTLKGVSGNLSIKTLADLLALQVKMFRDGDNKSAEELMPKITEAYNAAAEAIKD